MSTFEDHTILEREDFFLIPGTDQELLSFKVQPGLDGPVLVLTDKLGAEKSRFLVTRHHRLLVDYTANVENFFNFDIRLAKRAQLYGDSIEGLVEPGNEEAEFTLDEIRDIS